MKSKCDYDSFFNLALRFLSFRPRSQAEVEAYLVKKGVSASDLAKILQRLTELNFINDEAFARWWIARRRGDHPRGQHLISLELKDKGVDKELTASLLAESVKETDERSLAAKVAAKKAAKLRGLPEEEIRKKLYLTLAGRGFSGEVISETVAKILKKR